MQKDKRTKSKRLSDAKRAFKAHLKNKERDKKRPEKNKQRILKEAARRKKFQEHIQRLLGELGGPPQ